MYSFIQTFVQAWKIVEVSLICNDVEVQRNTNQTTHTKSKGTIFIENNCTLEVKWFETILVLNCPGVVNGSAAHLQDGSLWHRKAHLHDELEYIMHT